MAFSSVFQTPATLLSSDWLARKESIGSHEIVKSVFSERRANEHPTLLKIHQKEMEICLTSFEAWHENLSLHTLQDQYFCILEMSPNNELPRQMNRQYVHFRVHQFKQIIFIQLNFPISIFFLIARWQWTWYIKESMIPETMKIPDEQYATEVWEIWRTKCLILNKSCIDTHVLNHRNLVRHQLVYVNTCYYCT